MTLPPSPPAPIETRLAMAADRPALLAFIRDHWSARHVFVDAPEVFDWQYAQPDGRLNMVMAAQGGVILGVLGFIPTGRFDPALGDDDILLALWKVREDLAPPGLGLRLLKFLQSQLRPRMIGAIGISDMVGPIYRALGYTLDRLHQAAIFPPMSESGPMSESRQAPAAPPPLRIAAGVPAEAFAALSAPAEGWRLEQIAPDQGRARLVALADQIDALAMAGMPQKSWAYVQDRYLDHPFYDYHLGLLWQGAALHALAIWRRVACNGAHILRIVDIIGQTGWLAHGRALLGPVLVADAAEYLDLMQAGTPDALLQAGGWLSPDWVEGLILPNYFAPFEARNVTINLSWKLFAPEAAAPRLYRADSDQDRPNQAPVALRRQG